MVQCSRWIFLIHIQNSWRSQNVTFSRFLKISNILLQNFWQMKLFFITQIICNEKVTIINNSPKTSKKSTFQLDYASVKHALIFLKFGHDFFLVIYQQFFPICFEIQKRGVKMTHPNEQCSDFAKLNYLSSFLHLG